MAATNILLALTIGAAQPAPPPPTVATDSSASASGEAATSKTSKTVTVLPPSFEGQLEEHWRTELAERIERGFSQGDFKAIDGATLGRAVALCSDQECFSRAVRNAESDVVLMSTISVHERDYEISMQVLDTRDGATVASVQQLCGLCGAQEVVDMAEDVAATMRAKLDALVKAPPLLRISSDPSGASVTLDGKPVGRTPLELEVGEGEHVVRVEEAGYGPQERTVTSIAGVEDAVDIELLRQERKWKRPAKIAGWTSLGLGVGGIAAGAALLGLHEKPYRRPCEADADGDCRNLYNTRTAGIAAMAAGGAVMVMGVALVAAARAKKGERGASSRRAYIVPTTDGLVVRF